MGHILADIIFLIFGIAIILICAKRGFLKSVIHFFKTILAFVIAYFLGSRLAQFLCDNWIGGAVRNFIFDKINGVYQSAANSFNAEDVISSLPDFLMTEEMQSKLHAAEGSGAELVDSMTDAISTPIASLFSNILGYVGVFILALIGLWLLATVLDKLVEHMRFINTLNTLLGALLGLLVAVTVLSVVASLLRFFFAESPLYTESAVVKFFGESFLLKGLNFLDVGGSWFAELLN